MLAPFGIGMVLVMMRVPILGGNLGLRKTLKKRQLILFKCVVLSIHVTGFVGAIHFNIVWHGGSYVRYWFIGHLFFFLLLLPENLREEKNDKKVIFMFF